MKKQEFSNVAKFIAAAASGAIASFGAAAAVSAADLDPMEPPAELENWGGPYVGIHAGYASLNASNSTQDIFAQSWKQKADGPLGGVLVGYNFDMDGFVLGFEADAGFGGISKTSTRPGIGDVKITNHGQHTFRLRAGLPAGPGLFYATGGMALADIWARGPDGRDKQFLWGFTAGAGFETKVTEQISLRAEYLYGNYGKETFDLGTAAMKSDIETHNLRVGVSWYFR
jgi:outer membrane immunogenic protein